MRNKKIAAIFMIAVLLVSVFVFVGCEDPAVKVIYKDINPKYETDDGQRGAKCFRPHQDLHAERSRLRKVAQAARHARQPCLRPRYPHGVLDGGFRRNGLYDSA